MITLISLGFAVIDIILGIISGNYSYLLFDSILLDFLIRFTITFLLLIIFFRVIEKGVYGVAKNPSTEQF